MSGSPDPGQTRLIRDRFTRTAQAFAEFALKHRSAESEHLIELLAPKGRESALDFACGPGTLARWLAPRVRRVVGLDVTPAMLEQASRTARAEGFANFHCVCADAAALPFADAALDIAAGGFCLHHMTDPQAILREMARTIRPRGRVGILDLIVPDDPARAEANNRIERVRDPSHTRTLSESEISRMLEEAGFRVFALEIIERPREFNHWMHVAGWRPADAAYRDVRSLVLESFAGDSAAFGPRWITEAGGRRLEITQMVLFAVAERM